MPKGPKRDIEVPKNPYEGLTPDDLCPLKEKNQPKIKNCASKTKKKCCSGCRNFMQSWKDEQKKAKAATAQQTIMTEKVADAPAGVADVVPSKPSPLRGIVTPMRAAVAALLLAAATLIAASILKKKDFERNFSVEGVDISLDESWEKFDPPEGMSVSDLFKEEFKRLVPFYKKLGLDPSSKAWNFQYNPDEEGLNGALDRGFKPFGSGSTKKGPHLDRWGRLQPHMFIGRVTKKPEKIRLKIFLGRTIAHEGGHLLTGAQVSGSQMIDEGIAHFIGREYARKYPDANTPRCKALGEYEKEQSDQTKLDDEFFENPKVLATLSQQGWNDSWIAWGYDNQPDSHISSFLVAAEHWKKVFDKDPSFLARFIKKMEAENQKVKKNNPGMPEDGTIVCNLSQSLIFAHEIDKKGLVLKHLITNPSFQVARQGQRVRVAYVHKNGRNLTVLCGVRSPITANSNTFGISRTVNPIVPEPFFVEGKYIDRQQIIKDTFQVSLDLKDPNGNRGGVPRDLRIIDQQGRPIPIIWGENE